MKTIVILVLSVLPSACLGQDVVIVRQTRPAQVVLVERRGCLNRLFFGRFQTVVLPQSLSTQVRVQVRGSQ